MAKISEIQVKDVEKRRYPSKHYAYILEVTWSDGKISKMGRRYSDFFEFQMALLEKFPAEAGQQDPTKRIIPFLPGKSFFQRSNTREFAMKRIVAISEYCTGIAKMPSYILENNYLEEFFRPNADDRANHGRSVSPDNTGGKNGKTNEISGPLILDKYVAIAEYKKEVKKELNLKSGEVVEIVEKSENGWWLAANEEGMNGWVPAAYLEPLYGDISAENVRVKRGEGEMYEAVCDFSSESDEEISFKSGDLMEVLEKNLEGWWYAAKGNEEGWVPATYLNKSSARTPTKLNEEKKFENYRRESIMNNTKRPPPKRSTVRRTLTKAATAKIKVDFTQKMLMQEKLANKIPEENDDIDGVYITVGNFEATIKDGLSFQENQTVHVIQKSNTGWWYGRIKNKTGWVPESFLLMLSATPKIEPPKLIPPAVPAPPCPLPVSPTAPKGKPIRPEPVKKNILENSNTSNNLVAKPPKPKRPPAPKLSPSINESAKIFGGVKPIVSPKKKPQLWNLDTALPKRPVQKVNPSENTSPTKQINLNEFVWYRDISRQAAEIALSSEGEEGYFLIRPSKRGATNDKPYSLTLYHKGLNWNFHIRLRPDKKYAIGIYKEAEACFPTLPELVEHYKKSPLIIGEEEREVFLLDSPQELYDTC